MFFSKDYTHNILLLPKFIGPNVHKMLKDYLITKVEGKCSPSGYIISVLSISEIGKGKVQFNGDIAFRIKYKALVLNPVKGEIVDAQIVSFTKMGYFASIGPLSVFISVHQIPDKMVELLDKNVTIRLKIIGAKIDANKAYAVGTLKEDFLGIINQ